VEYRGQTGAESARVAGELTALVRQSVGVPVQVVLVPPRSLIMTSSGKLSRAANRARCSVRNAGASPGSRTKR